MLAESAVTIPIAPDRFPAAAGDLTRYAGKHALRLLIVDDEPLVRWSVAETLGETGYDIDEADDAESTVRALLDGGRPPDVVLLDLRLPDCSDLSLLATVRRLAPTATVVLMTAFPTREIRERALELGAACVLDKPFELDDLDGLIARLLARQ
jgi:DNA-binding NtrC family response regulator